MRIVIKVGTSTLAHSTGKLNIRAFEELTKVISDLKNYGHEIILVSSGAIGMGTGKLGLSARPKDTPTKQAAAAVGQCELMYMYDKYFGEYHHTVAQMLLTADDFEDKEKYANLSNTLGRLLELQALPVINENDTVSTAELGIGDNDTLSALVAIGAKADLLVLLSDIDGLYTSDPHKDENAKLISEADMSDGSIFSLGGDSSSNLGTGGMRTKLNAAKLVTEAGIDMIITNGSKPRLLYDIADGRSAGTRFKGKK
ncbi:MAG: glutamate 5-kinase [Clostridia bacterium]|nr:glutamate 5-kinase [Clostridia bacterium]